jgi:hypothetical protein
LDTLPFAQQTDEIMLLSKDQTDRITTILRNDVLWYFNLLSSSSNLKRKRFLESTEGKALQDSLLSLRNKSISQVYEIQIKTNAGDYDLEKKGFFITLDNHYLGWANATDQAIEEEYKKYKTEANVLKGIYFPSVPIKVSKSIFDSAFKLLFLKCKEDIAEGIEKKEVILHFIFSLKGDNEYYSHPTAKNVKLYCEVDGETIIERSFK